ncbi:MAG: purine-binding chemotaxis protein CheW [Spirochaetales bacterium]|nr:purine-binding chemotaxis protein CheW [Spirochaetales bacterium]
MSDIIDEEEDMLVSQLNVDISNQFVVFSVGEEEYGMPILSVQEITSMPKLTKVAGLPDYIPGIINLRGNVIPLYNLRGKFNMAQEEINSNTIVIIAQTSEENNRTVGFIVDTVSDVLSITPSDLSETPEFSSAVDTRYIEKIGRIGNRMIIIIDLAKILSSDEKAVIDRI